MKFEIGIPNTLNVAYLLTGTVVCGEKESGENEQLTDPSLRGRPVPDGTESVEPKCVIIAEKPGETSYKPMYS